MFEIKVPNLKIKLGKTHKKRHHKSSRKRSSISRRKRSIRRNKTKSLPKGDWIETAKNVKLINRNKLQAELKNRNGTYVLSSTYYRRGDIFENIDGNFVLVSNDYNSQKSRKTFNSRYYSRYHHGKYTKDTFNVYFNNKKTNISSMTFEDLGHGYARDAFAIYYKGDKINDAFHLKFQVLGREYAKDPFNVYKRGKKIPNQSPHDFTIF